MSDSDERDSTSAPESLLNASRKIERVVDVVGRWRQDKPDVNSLAKRALELSHCKAYLEDARNVIGLLNDSEDAREIFLRITAALRDLPDASDAQQKNSTLSVTNFPWAFDRRNKILSDLIKIASSDEQLYSNWTASGFHGGASWAYYREQVPVESVANEALRLEENWFVEFEAQRERWESRRLRRKSHSELERTFSKLLSKCSTFYMEFIEYLRRDLLIDRIRSASDRFCSMHAEPMKNSAAMLLYFVSQSSKETFRKNQTGTDTSAEKEPETATHQKKNDLPVEAAQNAALQTVTRKELRRLVEKEFGTTDKATQVRIGRSIKNEVLIEVEAGVFTSESVASFLSKQKHTPGRSNNYVPDDEDRTPDEEVLDPFDV